jgi:hypothetical protein
MNENELIALQWMMTMDGDYCELLDSTALAPACTWHMVRLVLLVTWPAISAAVPPPCTIITITTIVIITNHLPSECLYEALLSLLRSRPLPFAIELRCQRSLLCRLEPTAAATAAAATATAIRLVERQRLLSECCSSISVIAAAATAAATPLS